MSNSRYLGKYQLIAEIARGGMGLVYLAINSGLGGFNKILVVKELKPELVDEQSFLEMFLEEARLAAQLSHPNIVTTYEVGMDGKRPFIVMDYLEGQTLARILKKAGDQVTLPMQLRAIVGALEGLHYAHTRQALDGSSGSVVHRDISPQNIFVTYDGQVKVVDFGIAKASDTTIETRAGTFKGKPSYMAPQQLRGEPDARADVFSMGVILWEALAGTRMWPKKSDVEVLTALLKSEIPSIDAAAPGAPVELRRIVSKATTPDAETRYQSARAFADDLNGYLALISDRTTMGDFGNAIGEAFGEERQKVRRLVEKAIADSKAGPSSSGAPARIPSIAPPPEESSQPSGNRAPKIHVSNPPTSGVPSSTTQSGLTPQINSVGTPGPGAITLASEDDPNKNKQRTPWWMFAAALILLLGGVAFLVKTFALKGDTTTAKSEASSAPPPPAMSAVPPVTSAASTATADPSATVATAASSVKPAPAPTPTTRVVYVPVPVHTPPAPAKTATAPAATPAKVDCDPPFYFEGTKKIFKPGCL